MEELRNTGKARKLETGNVKPVSWESIKEKIRE